MQAQHERGKPGIKQIQLGTFPQPFAEVFVIRRQQADQLTCLQKDRGAQNSMRTVVVTLKSVRTQEILAGKMRLDEIPTYGRQCAYSSYNSNLSTGHT